MARAVNMSPLGLYNWDNTVFDLMQIPSALNRDTLIDNLLAETSELEVLYPNPIVFKNLVGVWSAKQLDIWNRLYATTQYEYNPIENYNRYETGSDNGTGRTTHSGTDTTTDTTTHGGSDSRTENLTTGGKDILDMSRREGGTEGKTGSSSMEQGGTEGTATTKREGGSETKEGSVSVEQGGTEGKTGSIAVEQGGTEGVTGSKQEGGTETERTTTSLTQGGQDTTTGSGTKEHWIAGFDTLQVTAQNDGLIKQTRDQDNETSSTAYGKTESGTGNKTTTFGKTVADSQTTTFGKTEDTETSETTTFGKTEDTETSETTTFGKTNTDSETVTFGKTEDTETSETTTFGKTETNKDETTYGKTENVQETKRFGETVSRTAGVTHGEQVSTTNEGEHELHAHGNIGVTTTQQLIKEQRAIELFNLYDIIIEDFKMRFCILIY